MMQVLVTGASGFLGANTVRRLASEGYRVAALVRTKTGAERVAAAGVEVRYADVRDVEAVGRAVVGCDSVVHTAASYRSDNASDSSFDAVNVEGTRNLARAALDAGVQRFVHVSTAGVHGHIERPPADESAPLAPRDVYQQSKLDGERVVGAFAERGLAAVVVRPVGLYGPGDTRFLKLFRGARSGWFPMLGRGDALYHLSYIDDVVDALARALEAPGALGRTMLVAGPEVTSVAELVARVADVVGGPKPRLRLPLAPFRFAAPIVQRACRLIGVEPPLYPRRLEFFTDCRAFDTTLAADVLGFRPGVGLDEGLRRTAEWYFEQGLLR